MIYAIDFDGTLCFDEYPRIGAPRPDVLDFAKRIRRAGDRLILWTCRIGDDLAAAVKWCEDHGLVFPRARDLDDAIGRVRYFPTIYGRFIHKSASFVIPCVGSS